MAVTSWRVVSRSKGLSVERCICAVKGRKFQIFLLAKLFFYLYVACTCPCYLLEYLIFHIKLIFIYFYEIFDPWLYRLFPRGHHNFLLIFNFDRQSSECTYWIVISIKSSCTYTSRTLVRSCFLYWPRPFVVAWWGISWAAPHNAKLISIWISKLPPPLVLKLPNRLSIFVV